MNLREKIKNANDIQEEIVDVPEWDVKILVRSLTGKERAELLNVCMTPGGQVDFKKLYPMLLIATCYDPETKEKIFEPADKDWLNMKSGAVIEKIASVATKLSGLGTDELVKARKN